MKILRGPSKVQAVPTVLKAPAFTRRILKGMQEQKAAYTSKSSSRRKRSIAQQ